MRRLTLIPVVIVVIAAFVTAWGNAQEGMKRRSSVEPTPALLPHDEAKLAPIVAPEGAVELRNANGGSEWQPRGRVVAGGASEVIPVAGEEGNPSTARRLFRGGTGSGSSTKPSGSSLPAPPPPIAPSPIPTAKPAPKQPAALPKDEDATQVESQGALEMASPIVEATEETGVPSVLKKKAGQAPTKSPSAAESSRRVPSGGGGASSPGALNIPARNSGVKASAVAPVSITGSTAKLTVEAAGPSAVTLGKPASYVVQLANQGSQKATGVEVRVGLPTWVALQGGEGSSGEARPENDTAGRQWLVWSLPEVPAGADEQLKLELVVKQNQPFELALQYSQRPQMVSGEISVREPQLEVRLEGPSDMLYGDQKNFTLHVSNPGTGDAENVIVEVASSNGTPNRVEVGPLSAGDQKHIPFAVAATAPGEMEIRAVAIGDGGLKTEAASRVIVHRAQLQVAVGAPAMKFAGSEVTYQVAVANVGDATAEQVVLGIELPTGAKYLGGIDGSATAGGGFNLKVGNLAPNAEKLFEIRCLLLQSGENRMNAVAQGKGDLVASEAAITQIEALADLKLSLNEPAGPAPVGSEAMYEVRIANRGTKGAENVKIVVQFAEGIEPIEAQGGTAEVANGQVLFQPLAELAAGREIVLKVKAKIEQPGSHQFRVEVKAGDPETRLVSEGVTRCFADSAPAAATARKLSPAGTPGKSAPSPFKTR